MNQKINTLVCHVAYPSRMSYVEDWLDAFTEHKALNIFPVNLYSKSAFAQIKEKIRVVDLIVLLHSCTADSLLYLKPIIPLLKDRKCKLVSFVGNELNMPHIPLSSRIEVLRDIGADYVATQLLEEAGKWLYQSLNTRVISIPHALNPAAFKVKNSFPHRKISIGVRGHRYPPYLGDNDRNRIVEYFTKFPHTDICFDSQLSRPKWAEFLNNCRATVTTESGSWYLERDDHTVMQIYKDTIKKDARFILARDKSSLKFLNSLPFSLKQFLKKVMKFLPVVDEAFLLTQQNNFDDIYKKYFKNIPPCPVYSKAISSRHFDAIGCGTLLVALKGRYNDILTANQHYIELMPDCSNDLEILSKIEDGSYCERMARDTLEYVLALHTHRHRIDRLIEDI
jgi:hypothetical protein